MRDQIYIRVFDPVRGSPKPPRLVDTRRRSIRGHLLAKLAYLAAVEPGQSLSRVDMLNALWPDELVRDNLPARLRDVISTCFQDSHLTHVLIRDRENLRLDEALVRSDIGDFCCGVRAAAELEGEARLVQLLKAVDAFGHGFPSQRANWLSSERSEITLDYARSVSIIHHDLRTSGQFSKASEYIRRAVLSIDREVRKNPTHFKLIEAAVALRRLGMDDSSIRGFHTRLLEWQRGLSIDPRIERLFDVGPPESNPPCIPPIDRPPSVIPSHVSIGMKSDPITPTDTMHEIDSTYLSAKPDITRSESAITDPSCVFCVPFDRNCRFTGRDDILKDLDRVLTSEREVVIKQALSGLGGIGKTQTALEYCYRHRDRATYRAILWANAETPANLEQSYIAIAEALELPECHAEDRSIVMKAVLRWLSVNRHWLLVLDNADDLTIIRTALPAAPGGSTLITTRSTDLLNWNVESVLSLGVLKDSEALNFLLSRTGRDDCTESEREAASHLACELGFLPLALEQAAAYIVKKRTTFSAFLVGFRTVHRDALTQYEPAIGDYRATVAKTWAINFEQVSSHSEEAARILRICAFLYPTEIPKLLFASLANDDELVLDDLLAQLCEYSLVSVNVDRGTLDIHRLVQVVLRDSMDSDDQRKLCVEDAVSMLARSGSDQPLTDWSTCESLLPHQLACIDYLGPLGINSEESVTMLNQTALYLRERAKLSDAHRLYEQAKMIGEQYLGPTHPLLATTLNDMAVLLIAAGQISKVGGLFERALAIREAVFDPNHPAVAKSLNDFAHYHNSSGRHEIARKLHERALEIRTRAYGPDHLETAASLSNLGATYRSLGHLKQSLEHFQKALEIRRRYLRADHLVIATNLNNLGCVYDNLGDFGKAESLFIQALQIREQVLGPDHPVTGTTLNDLGSLYRLLGRFDDAEPLYVRALSIRQRTFGELHFSTADSMNNLGLLYEAQGRLQEAESYLTRALGIRNQVLEKNHPATAITLNDLATVYRRQGRLFEAEGLLRQALRLRRRSFGPEHPETGATLHNLAFVLDGQGRAKAAISTLRRALAIREKSLEPGHIWTAQSVIDLAELLVKSEHYREATTLFERAVSIRMDALGSDHADTVATQQRLNELKSLMHPSHATTKHNG